MRIALNGFGRIGKAFVRTLLANDSAWQHLELVAINIGPNDPESVPYSLLYDSLWPAYSGDVTYKNNILKVCSREVQILAQMDPLRLPWKELRVDWVVEATGAFTAAKDAKKHIDAGAKKVLITAPAHDEDVTIIPGINDKEYMVDHHTIVSLGSCTTNALVPMLKVVQEAFGIEYACMTTVHAYTNSQALLDVNPQKKNPRRSRAAALNIVPTSSGALKVVDKIMPELEGKVSGGALRVPVPVVSLIDLTAATTKKCNAIDVNESFKKAASGQLKKIIAVTDQPLVSSDFKQNEHSVTIDMLLTDHNGPLIKVFGWYDNEWGYSCRLRDFLVSVS